MDVFSAMRKALASVAPMLARIDAMERRQIVDQSRNEERFGTIFKAMDGGDFPPQKVFFGGKHYEAFSFARKLVRKATKSIVLVDNYCDDTTLDILSQKRGGVDVTIEGDVRGTCAGDVRVSCENTAVHARAAILLSGLLPFPENMIECDQKELVYEKNNPHDTLRPEASRSRSKLRTDGDTPRETRFLQADE